MTLTGILDPIAIELLHRVAWTWPGEQQQRWRIRWDRQPGIIRIWRAPP
jgi:hypothetical protein